jgi:DNA-binding GntR family transcriptional regulator
MAAHDHESRGRNGEPLGQSRSAAERLIADRAHEELRDLIVTLKLAPGALLREDELMAQLGIGRTPLRDAIKRLSLEGLVAVQPRRGTTITPVDVSDIVHITEVRAELEGLAAELAALRMSEEQLAGCRQWMERLGDLDRRTGPEGLMRMDTEIHRFTWRAAGNPYLVQTLERYFALSSRVWYMVIDRVPGLAGAVHHQEKLLEALIDRDPPRARRAMREHVLEFQREMLLAFSQTGALDDRR